MHEILLLGLSCFLCFALSVFRLIYSDTIHFAFLNWNLFLAFLPWLFSTILIGFPSIHKNKMLVGGVMCVWLLFFPNAPYILTDLLHLRLNTTMPAWFDLLLILSYAWTGLMFGLLGLFKIEAVLEKSFKSITVRFIALGMLFAGSFGIYLGRFLRWNSWDVIGRPRGLYEDISDRMLNPLEHPRAWGMTIVMFLFLNIVYWSLKHFERRR